MSNKPRHLLNEFLAEKLGDGRTRGGALADFLEALRLNLHKTEADMVSYRNFVYHVRCGRKIIPLGEEGAWARALGIPEGSAEWRRFREIVEGARAWRPRAQPYLDRLEAENEALRLKVASLTATLAAARAELRQSRQDDEPELLAPE